MIGGLMNNNIYKTLIFVVMSLLLCMSVEAASRAHEQDTNYDNSFMKLKEIVNKTYTERWIETNDWWYYNARKYNSVDSMNFEKDFWMPIEPWEYEVCSRGLTTQLTYEGNAGAGSMFSGIYADTVTLAAYKRVPERNIDVDPSMLYEVSWYFHPTGEGKYYNVKMISSSTGASKEIQARTGASKRSGSVGYVAFYSATNYDKVVLSDESTPQDYSFNIVPTNDSNR
jgi:hypothetical protein